MIKQMYYAFTHAFNHSKSQNGSPSPLSVHLHEDLAYSMPLFQAQVSFTPESSSISFISLANTRVKQNVLFAAVNDTLKELFSCSTFISFPYPTCQENNGHCTRTTWREDLEISELHHIQSAHSFSPNQTQGTQKKSKLQLWHTL